MLGSLTLMNLPSKDTPAHTGQSLSFQAQTVGVALLINPSKKAQVLDARLLMLGSLKLMNLPSKDTPAHTGQSLSFQAQTAGVALLVYPSKDTHLDKDSIMVENQCAGKTAESCPQQAASVHA